MSECLTGVDYKTFQADAADFLTKLGEKSFWELPDEKQDDWFRGLGWSFTMLRTDSKEENERATRLFEGVCNEFARRRAIVITTRIFGKPFAQT